MKFTEETWKHIRQRHPELSVYKELVELVSDQPEVILRGERGKFKAVRFIPQTHLGPKYLVVVYHRVDKIIITSYFTSDLKRVKGEMVWKA